MTIEIPESGLLAMRIALEFGDAETFADSLQRAVADGGAGGATLVAHLDRGDLGIHIPHRDGPSWNAVPLIHLYPGQTPGPDDWAAANATLERLERFR